MASPTRANEIPYTISISLNATPQSSLNMDSLQSDVGMSASHSGPTTSHVPAHAPNYGPNTSHSSCDAVDSSLDVDSSPPTLGELAHTNTCEPTLSHSPSNDMVPSTSFIDMTQSAVEDSSSSEVSPSATDFVPLPPLATDLNNLHSMQTRSKHGITKPNPKYLDFHAARISLTLPTEPRSVKSALHHLGWKAAKHDELEALFANHT